MKKVRFVIFVLLALAISATAQAQQLNRNKVQWSMDIMPVGGSLYDSGRIGGALAGAVIGLLVAPAKGSDTRDKITDAVDDFMKKHISPARKASRIGNSEARLFSLLL